LISKGFRLKQFTDEELEAIWEKVKNGPAVNRKNWEGFKKSYSPLEDLVFEHDYGLVRFSRITRGGWMEFHGFMLDHRGFGIIDDVRDLIIDTAKRYSIRVVFSAVPRRGGKSVGKLLEKFGFERYGYNHDTDKVEYYFLVNGGYYGRG
jgi:hypothetical protein